MKKALKRFVIAIIMIFGVASCCRYISGAIYGGITDALFSDNSEKTENTGNTSGTSTSSRKGIRPEFKATIDSYEEFIDEYVIFMKKYTSSSDALSMMSDYLSYMEKYAEVMDNLGKLGDEEMSDEEIGYYTAAMLRIQKKMSSVYSR